MSKMLALSYHDRLVHEISEEAYVKTEILPADPIPLLENSLSKIYDRGYEQSVYTNLRNMILSKKSTSDEILATIREQSNDKYVQMIILITLIFDFGHKSLTHFNAAVKKFNSALTEMVCDFEMKVFTIEMINNICFKHPEVSIGVIALYL